MHTLVGLQEVAVVITASLLGGLLLERFRQPAILGYILAGLILGPSVLGYIENVVLIKLFADFGILMLLFVIGMSLDLESFKRNMTLSLAVVAGQIGAGLLVALVLHVLLGWNLTLSLLVAFILALSSTAVAVKMLEASHDFNSNVGRLTLGVLIAQDLAIVPMILILKGVDRGIEWGVLGLRIGLALGILSLFVWWFSRPRKVPLFVHFSASRPELPALVSLSLCFGLAAVSGYLDLSTAYGAFLGGMILGNLKERVTLLQVVMPIYSVLVMTFFLSVGLLLKLDFILQNFWLILVLSLGIMSFKTLVNFGILRLLKQPWPTTFLSGVMLSQLGEFAFLLLSVVGGKETKAISPFGLQLITTLTAISLAMSPLWLAMAGRVHIYRLKAQATFQQTLGVYLHLLGGWADRRFTKKGADAALLKRPTKSQDKKKKGDPS